MASRLMNQIWAKAAEASKLAARRGSEYYQKLLAQNERYIQEPPTVENCQLLAKKLFYTRLASIPHRREAFWKEIDGLKNHLKQRPELKLEDVGIAALFGVECLALLWAGQIAGRELAFPDYPL